MKLRLPLVLQRLRWRRSADRVRRQTLAWANSIRAERGWPVLDDFPAGYPNAPQDCPLARALSHDTHEAAVGVNLYSTDAEGKWGEWLDLPAFARRFVQLFDLGYYPDLDKTTHQRNRKEN